MSITKHVLKTDPDVFQLSWDGLKDYEIRYNDRDYQVGDHLELQETKFSGAEMALLDEYCVEFTGCVLHCEITHVLSGYGLQEGWVILSLKPVVALSDTAAEIEQGLNEMALLNCPACGGSGHTDDAQAAGGVAEEHY
ncbi:DUF3850 domain-containing protein [Marinobacterium jannaschii]|uniref:DUF3850 domain-containing protein n=1 Tax=Marinobacterium jannaschii TaxID=64970 RepID=UPI000AD54F80|nr:DUF3850 domain-containing protein [Marinobacterium jannaschii]